MRRLCIKVSHAPWIVSREDLAASYAESMIPLILSKFEASLTPRKEVSL